ncbi:DNA replication inhibitor plutonium [Pseudolycoriella hygida]|uniref:DNA replication inhibitor plutonium n=1 Tax=Pseudolycoriella hygida TaxID=35572 RepID=A0A9Q0N9B8_9DIPT|nr:DNA replication inhibitor plutonium [Pseudolycoriella hygida]
MDNNNNVVGAFELLQGFIQKGDASSLKKELLKSTSDVEYRDDNGNTLLLIAAYLGKSDCVDILLEIGQANFEAINVFGQNALTLASYVGCIDCIKMLLTKWSYKNYTESTLLPPLCVAAMRGHLEIVDLFCQLTPSPNDIKSVHGVTPMDLAKKNGHIEVVQRLLEAAKPMERSGKEKEKCFTTRYKPYSKK